MIRHQRKGMSLIEITIVMLILGILAAVASPRFANSLQHGRLIAATNQIAGHIDYVRRAAINEGKASSFRCDADADTYWSTEVDFPQLVGQLLNVNIKSTHDPTFELSADFDGHSALYFDFEGVPHVAGGAPLLDGKVTLAAGNRTFDILIAAGTGETTITERTDNAPEHEDTYVSGGS